jgi:hypothetical protein
MQHNRLKAVLSNTLILAATIALYFGLVAEAAMLIALLGFLLSLGK